MRGRRAGARVGAMELTNRETWTLIHGLVIGSWHKFGMEWKEHLAWISPMLATAAAFLVLYYGAALVRRRDLRRLVTVLFVAAFVTAAIAGLFGALITKAAPVR